MADVLGHSWMRGEVMSEADYQSNCRKYMDAVLKEKDEVSDQLGIDHAVEKKTRRCTVDLRSIKDVLVQTNHRPLQKDGFLGLRKAFYIKGQPLDVLQMLCDIAS